MWFAGFRLGVIFAYGPGIFFRGFGLGRLVGQGFLGAKAGHSDRAVRRVEESCFCFGKAGQNLLFQK